MSELGLQIETRERVNRRVYRMGLESRPLLSFVSILVIVCVLLYAVLGIIGLLVDCFFVYVFFYITRKLQKEIEKGNYRPLDSYFENIQRPTHIVDDGVIEMYRFKLKRSKHERELKQIDTY